MLTKRAISAEKRRQAGFGKRKSASAALLLFSLFATFFATAQRAFADTGIPDTGAIEATVDPSVQAPPVATTLLQDAVTGQAATADATAAEPEQSNSIETAPTDSSGVLSGSEANDAAVAGAAANDASTNQATGGESTADGLPAETDQQATTDQAADAAASAVQPQQSNVVIIIRVNSPGDDVISQTNVVSVVGAAANQSSTTQNQGSTTQNPAPAGAPVSGTSDPTQSQAAGGPTTTTDGRPQPSGAVPQSAQSAGAQRPVRSAGAVQGQRPHAARALSVLGSSGGSTASPPAPEHQSGAGPTTNRSDGSVTGSAKTAASVTSVGSAVAGAGSGSGRAVGHADRASVGRVAGVLHRIASWSGGKARTLRSAASADRPEGGWNLGLTTLATLLVGLLGWFALTWMPSLRRVPRPRGGR